MNLKRKALMYSALLTLLSSAFILFYLMYLMPSLYLDSMKVKNLKTSEEYMTELLGSRSIEDARQPSRYSTFTLLIPSQGNTVTFWNETQLIYITFKNPEIMKFIDEIRNISLSMDKDYSDDITFPDPEKLLGIFTENLKNQNFDITIGKPRDQDIEEVSEEDTEFNFHKGEDYILYENSFFQDKNLYTTFFGIGKKDGNTYVTMIPFSVSKIDDIRDIAIGSMPMILAVLILLIIIFTFLFSGQIVNPIVSLTRHTRKLRSSKLKEEDRFRRREKDEIWELGKDIDDMYLDLKNTMEDLKEEMESRELFLKAGSHQLKTPVAASMLLVDSMADNIGKSGTGTGIYLKSNLSSSPCRK